MYIGGYLTQRPISFIIHAKSLPMLQNTWNFGDARKTHIAIIRHYFWRQTIFEGPVWPKNWFFWREGLLWRAVAPRIIIRKNIWKYYCDPLEQGFHQVYLTKFYFFLNPNWYPGLGLNVRIMENLWSCLIMASLSRLLSWCHGLLAEKIYHWIPDEVERALPFSDRWADEIEHGYRVGSEARSVLKYRS
jgi:hypothetical protein